MLANVVNCKLKETSISNDLWAIKYEIYFRHISFVHEQEYKVLQFYEKRSFRNLIHLSLPIQDPPVRIILYYINETLGTLQQQCHVYNGQANKLQKEMEYKDQQIHDLNLELNNMSSKLAEQENLVFARNTEVNR